MKHPYEEAPNYRKWSRAIARKQPSEVDPVVRFRFKIGKSDRIATAGSCFAQHISRSLAASGFNFFIAEKAHPFVENVEHEYGYGLFSARFGNIYTARQLVQLAYRAYGMFRPQVEYYLDDKGRYFDPLRPSIQPGGFSSLEEYRADRAQHLDAVRRMFENLDYFVFTLGLTECWVSVADGTAYPVCPGVIAGAFDPEKHRFVNFGVSEVKGDLEKFMAFVKSVNPKARFIFTVSPVALAATAEDHHVLCSTTYSKSVLRVVAEELQNEHPYVAYFPSYEIITGAFNRTNYLTPDLREANEEGVAHVMRLFMKHATANEQATSSPQIESHEPDAASAAMAGFLKAECDEMLLGA
jgi:hypothetical protein